MSNKSWKEVLFLRRENKELKEEISLLKEFVRKNSVKKENWFVKSIKKLLFCEV